MGKWKEMIEDRYLKRLEELSKELKKEKQKIYILTQEEVEEFYKGVKEEVEEYNDLMEKIKDLF